MSNTDLHRAAHEAFNRRDWDEVARMSRDDLMYTDHPRNLTLKSRQEYVDWGKGWVAGFSDAKVNEARYLDAGDHSIAIFEGRGTNDGQMGPLPATGKRMAMPYCEVLEFDTEGRIVSGEMFYDTMTMLVQLGLAEAPPSS